MYKKSMQGFITNNFECMLDFIKKLKNNENVQLYNMLKNKKNTRLINILRKIKKELLLNRIITILFFFYNIFVIMITR